METHSRRARGDRGAARSLGEVSSALPIPVTLGDRFARELAEMAVPWRAEDVPDPRLLLLNEPLAIDLGFEAAFLLSPEGLRMLVGNLPPGGATPVAQAYAGHQFGGYPLVSATGAPSCSARSSTPTAICATCTSRARGARRSRAAATGWPRLARCCVSTS